MCLKWVSLPAVPDSYRSRDLQLQDKVQKHQVQVQELKSIMNIVLWVLELW
jgi:hypothetical protein